MCKVGLIVGTAEYSVGSNKNRVVQGEVRHVSRNQNTYGFVRSLDCILSTKRPVEGLIQGDGKIVALL